MTGLEQDKALLQDLAAWASLSPSRLAAEAGLADTTITRSIKGTATTRLSQPTMDKLRARFPDYPGWLKSVASDARIPFRGAEREVPAGMVAVAGIELDFGLGAAFMDQDIVEHQVGKHLFPSDWLRMISDTDPAHLYWARGVGNSMEPEIKDGDVILIDRSKVGSSFGDLYWAIAYGQTGMVKRLRPMPDGSVKILSDNANVPPEIAYDGELHVFGRVVAVIKRI